MNRSLFSLLRGPELGNSLRELVNLRQQICEPEVANFFDEKQNWYQWYLEEGLNGSLALPEYTFDDAGHFVIHYGELYCRIEGCNKKHHCFQSTNNLRTHIKSHFEEKDDVLGKEDKGGRVSQKDQDAAIRWYKSLFQGASASTTASESLSASKKSTASTPASKSLSTPKKSTSSAAGSSSVQTIPSTAGFTPVNTPARNKPKLPVTKQKKPHLTFMRCLVLQYGGKDSELSEPEDDADVESEYSAEDAAGEAAGESTVDSPIEVD
ncbi:hypothetical protein BO71DRAFT_485163 [Aspergillus ellipticus CBS 707.79]|uniref:Uncharacterized protein n=1 Tax=Aspergillus ellipticus CBS 707.79 TaxID=1448320 RepID=A0A319D6F9_9EURO|nr:hypothetical protein BO71DRAFT_485163 [Aspergillus ellipticus CBS 707.79]